MTEEQAKEYLNNNYVCCCPFGTSPTKCGDEKCEFGQAIRALLEEKTQGEWIRLAARLYKCKGCGNISDLKSPYCASCGAKMKQV